MRRAVGCTCAGLQGCFGSVDNQLPSFANAYDALADGVIVGGPGADRFRPRVRDEIDSARNVLLIELLDVDSFANDSSVRIRLMRGFPAPGAPCARAMVDSLYQVDARSLDAPQSLEQAWEVTGAIRRGRIEMSTDASRPLSMSWPLFADVPTLDLPTQSIRLSADVAPSAMTLGNFGGAIRAEDMVSTLAASAPDYVSVLRGLLGGYIDIMESGVCEDSATSRSGRVSIGFGFSAVRVRIDPEQPVVSGPSPGSCLFDTTRSDGGSDP